MGNYASCVLVGAMGKHSKAARVILPSGEIKVLDEPTNAAELMLEVPNFFLVHSKSLQMGHKFSALNADVELQMGCVYVMFPMKRVGSKITDADVAAVFRAANRGSSKVKVVPTCGDDDVDGSVQDLFGLPEFKQRRSSFCRSKKPLLETIAEEPMWVC